MSYRTVAKALAAAGAACGVTASVLAPGHVDASGLSAIIVSWFGVVSVFIVKNADTTPSRD